MMRAIYIAALLLCSPALADPVQDAFADYAGFATYDAGIMRPEQLTADIIGAVHFIDTRSAADFATRTIPDAQHIEWRDIFDRIEDIPTDQKVVLFCNTGALSAQAAFGLRVLGYDNVLVLQTGFDGWLAHQAAQ